MKALVTGSAGMLGSAVIDTLRAARCEIVATGRSARGEAVLPMDSPGLEIQCARRSASTSRIWFCIWRLKPMWISASSTPTTPHASNAFGTQNVVRACGEQGAVMVYVSTANVFDGEKREPYTEYDTPGFGQCLWPTRNMPGNASSNSRSTAISSFEPVGWWGDGRSTRNSSTPWSGSAVKTEGVESGR